MWKSNIHLSAVWCTLWLSSSKILTPVAGGGDLHLLPRGQATFFKFSHSRCNTILHISAIKKESKFFFKFRLHLFAHNSEMRSLVLDITMPRSWLIMYAKSVIRICFQRLCIKQELIISLLLFDLLCFLFPNRIPLKSIRQIIPLSHCNDLARFLTWLTRINLHFNCESTWTVYFDYNIFFKLQIAVLFKITQLITCSKFYRFVYFWTI